MLFVVFEEIYILESKAYQNIIVWRTLDLLVMELLKYGEFPYALE